MGAVKAGLLVYARKGVLSNIDGVRVRIIVDKI